jgi:iron-sulfur cluster repair protein YtfE (RIC family)
MPEDALAILKDGHKKILDYFCRYEAATNPYVKGLGALHAFTELEAHAQLEAEVFYPAFAQVSGESARIAESAEDHQAVSDLIRELRNIKPDAPYFHALFQQLVDHMKGHIAAEETELFPRAAESLAAQMVPLTTAMQVLKRRLLS